MTEHSTDEDSSGDDFRERHLRSADFLGAFGVLETDAGILMVQNRRVIDGISVLTWDLPGGQVEPGEDLHGALRRELEEETGVRLSAPPEFLFVQEGLRTMSGERSFVWRSFFFSTAAWSGVPQACGEVLDCRWLRRDDMHSELTAPYHDSFLRWLTGGGTFFSSNWSD